MVIAKLNKSNIFDGCLTHLRSELESELPAGQSWVLDGGIQKLVGCKEPYDQHNYPYTSAPSYYKIYFGKHYIKPTHYALLGRRAATGNCLRGWNFFGRNIKNEWVLLSSFSNSQFSQNELRIFEINISGPFTGFMLEMTQPNSDNAWSLTIGQIDVFGYIYDKIAEDKYCTQSSSIMRIKLTFLLVILIFK